MKTLVEMLAGAALLTAPMTVQAQTHGGGGHGGGGGFHGGGGGGGFHGGGFHGGGFRGGGFRGGGFRGGGFRGGGFYRGGYYGGYYGGFYGAPFFFGAGLGLGLAYYDPWFWGYPGDYGYYGRPIYYDYDYDYSDDDDAPPSGYYRGTMPEDDAATGPNAHPPAASQAAPPAKACGTWRWDSTAQKYQWDAAGC